jgi:hypothetical protein
LERKNSEKKIRGLAKAVVNGKLDMKLPLTLERNRTKRSALAAWNGIIGGARMFGEDALADAALQAAVDQCATGQQWPERPLDAGIQAFGGHMMVRWSSPMNSGDLNMRGYVAPLGPVLTNTDWHAVMITEARSTDGISLSLRLEPFADSVSQLQLEFSQLRPNTMYSVGNALQTFTSNDSGNGSFTLAHLDSSLHLIIVPGDQ